MAGEGVAKVSASAVFKACGFDDKNNNGVIDKFDRYGRPAGEGYNVNADIDRDGKTVGAEAKYYLWCFLRDEKKAKQYPITDADRKNLIPIFNLALDKARAKKEDCGDVILKMFKAGLHEKAKSERDKLNDKESRFTVSREMALKLTEEQKFDEAMEVLSKEDKIKMSYTLSKVAIAAAKAGFFDKAMAIMDGVKDSYDKSIACSDISNFEADSSKFKEALIAARKIENSAIQTDALRYVLAKMNEKGMKKREIRDLFQETNNTIP